MILAILLLVKTGIDYWILDSAIYVLVLRILWQFRFHKNCDGKLIAMMIIDDPMIDLETSFKLKHKELKNNIWLILKIVGYIVGIIIFIILIYPVINYIL
ncbi:MAG: hypothetical protein KFW09_05720 [Oscillospiraceae bacterium]|nr:hypothetical protein [Oscillospiraceae bacterium]